MDDRTRKAGSLTQVAAVLPSLQNLANGNVSLGSAVTLEKATLATARATLMFGCFRRDEASDPEIFMDAAIAILLDYPDDVIISVTDPRNGIPSRQKWPPQPQEVKAACEELYAFERRKQAREAKLKEQFDERAKSEATGNPQQTYDEFRAEMAARGMPIQKNDRLISDSVVEVKAKYELTDAQWDAIPDAPTRKDYWEGKRW